MSNQKSVWVVTSGDYSDYGINRIFSTQKKAQDWIDLNAGSSRDYHEPAEWAVDDGEDMALVARGRRLWSCSQTTRGDGRVYSSYGEEIRVEPASDGEVESEPEFNRFDYPASYGSLEGAWFEEYTLNVMARNFEHAQKIASDKITQARAEREGIA